MKTAATESNHLRNWANILKWKHISHIYQAWILLLFSLQHVMHFVSLMHIKKNVVRIKLSHLKLERSGNYGTTAAYLRGCVRTSRFGLLRTFLVIFWLLSTHILKRDMQTWFELQIKGIKLFREVREGVRSGAISTKTELTVEGSWGLQDDVWLCKHAVVRIKGGIRLEHHRQTIMRHACWGGSCAVTAGIL